MFFYIRFLFFLIRWKIWIREKIWFLKNLICKLLGHQSHIFLSIVVISYLSLIVEKWFCLIIIWIIFERLIINHSILKIFLILKITFISIPERKLRVFLYIRLKISILMKKYFFLFKIEIEIIMPCTFVLISSFLYIYVYFIDKMSWFRALR